MPDKLGQEPNRRKKGMADLFLLSVYQAARQLTLGRSGRKLMA